MRYVALACDYDGTIAHEEVVDDKTVAALERAAASGRRLMLVTGRELAELRCVFPRLDLFAWVVAENGALLYQPATQSEKPLHDPPAEAFIAALRARHVEPLSVGRVMVATWQPHEHTVLAVIRELGLELQVIFNKGAVMVLPSGVNKGTGLQAALDAEYLSPHNVVGVGDAENDHAFLSVCECAVAVANALPVLKERADVVTAGDDGRGVTELIDAMLADDLQHYDERLRRHDIPVGSDSEGKNVLIPPYGSGVLLAGPSGSGKSTLATGLLERLAAQRYQFCLIDPKGDYSELEGAISIGDPERSPNIDEVIRLLQDPTQRVVVSLLGIKLEDRPGFFAQLMPRLQELRTELGHPHWIVIDEAHHLLPAAWQPVALTLPRESGSLMLITVHPGDVANEALAAMDVVIAVGDNPDDTLSTFSASLRAPQPRKTGLALEANEALVWFRNQGDTPVRVQSEPPQGEHRRHVRKYAKGDLAPEISFYFRGPKDRLNLRAQNLDLFMQVADGVDDETWLYHLRRGDYARWFRKIIKDDELADEAERIAADAGLLAKASRDRMREAITKRYVA